MPLRARHPEDLTQPHLYLTAKQPQPFEALVRELNDGHAIIEVLEDYRNPRHTVWGINARNQEQNFALNLLMDPKIDFVSISFTVNVNVLSLLL